jgi:hypothetical protein
MRLRKSAAFPTLALPRSGYRVIDLIGSKSQPASPAPLAYTIIFIQSYTLGDQESIEKI